MKVTTIDVQRYAMANSSDVQFEILVVDILSDLGHRGRGYQMVFGAYGQAAASFLKHHLAPSILDENPWRSSMLWDRMLAAVPRRGADGFVRGSIAAIDMAVWDLKAQSVALPVSALFGGHRDAIPTYANCAHNLPPDELAQKALEYVGNGHRALKIRGTNLALTQVNARIQAVREAVGPDVRLMVDVNGTWDVDTAVQQLKRWERFDVYWLEEPVTPADIAGYKRIRERAGNTYIVGGEQHIGLSEFRALIDNGGVDIVQPNVSMTGGITDWLRIHGYATALGVPVSPWNMQAIHIHMAVGLPNILWVEYFMPDNPLLAFKEKLFAGPHIAEEVRADGVYLRAPSAPGFDLELDDEFAAASLVG